MTTAAPRSHLAQAWDVAMTCTGRRPARSRHRPEAAQHLRRVQAWSAGPGMDLSCLVHGHMAQTPSCRLVLVHGTPGEAAGWVDYLVEPVPGPGLQILALDRPGFGGSGPGRAVTSLAVQAQAVLQMCPDDGVPTVLLGHSLGGAVVAAAAALQPHRVQALVLLAAALDPDLERVHPLQRVGAWPGVRQLLPSGIRHANEELLALERELRWLAPLLQRVRCPTQVVHGTQDVLVPPAHVHYAQARLTGVRELEVNWLQGQGHFLPWSAESAVRRALGDAVEQATAIGWVPS